ncbi:MAG: NUDIX hydrolase [Candidatus Devosia phytovorans]|uniref:NUDIX hydrolase n=1 Tax=Candidatus Devosia phytovorans TaxID=3121372 RepID=A0AAJ6B2E8_9HYPH|nr:NUDIX hydrolase [Devosia sp.]WEK05483.1 MAG: NUDIX hydrolase [Devosia sp.]
MLLDFLRTLGGRAAPGSGLRQSGALPYTILKGRVVFLLVTSRKTGRWIFPKGSISAGLTPWDSAAKEAMEEAGVTGEVSSTPIGSYQNMDKGVPVDVDLYPLKVEHQMDNWDEMDQRLRHWALLSETRRLLADRSLSRLADALHRQVGGGTIQ